MTLSRSNAQHLVLVLFRNRVEDHEPLDFSRAFHRKAALEDGTNRIGLLDLGIRTDIMSFKLRRTYSPLQSPTG